MNRLWFLLLVGALGGLALVSQVLLMRQLLVAFYGTEMVIAMVLAGWLFGVSLGARLAGMIKWADLNRLRIWLLATPPLWTSVLMVTLVGSYFIPGLTGLIPGELAPLHTVLLWSWGLTVPASLFVGGLFVLAGSYWNLNWMSRGARSQGVGGTIFLVESAGSCLGLLAYTYVLVGRFGPIQVLIVFSGVLLAALALSLPRLISVKCTAVGIVLIATAGVIVTGLGAKLDRAADAARFARANPGYTLSATRDTPYQHLAVAKRGGESVLFGNQIFMASWPDPSHYQVLTLLFLTEAARSDRVLLAGQGPGGFIHELLQRGVKELVYVTLDPMETVLVTRHLSPQQVRDMADPRLTVIHDDLRSFLEEYSGRPFDLIIVNAPDPDNAQINRLYTRDFFESAKRSLSSDGLIATSISGAENYWSSELLSYGTSLYQTMRAVFPEVVLTAGDRHYLFGGVNPGVATDDSDVLATRYRARGFESPYFTPRSFLLFFQPSALAYIRARLNEARTYHLNTDARPLSYFLRLVWWEKMTGGPWTKRLLGRALRPGSWWPWAAGAVSLPFVLILLRPAPRRAACWTMALTGGMTMALQILLIFLFQNRHGIIYHQIALFSALFMAGLAGGGLCGRFAASNGFNPVRILPVTELLLSAGAVLTALMTLNRVPDMIWTVVVGTGFVSGLEFALLFALYLEDGTQPTVSQALARLEAADHAGAVIGSLATGLILAPVIGLTMTAWALAVLKVCGALVLLRPLRNGSAA